MTMNEEVNIARCLCSISWSNDVVVLDSGSTDTTRSIARQFSNVRLFERAFTDFADQRNYGLHQIPYANKWLLILDADEEIDFDFVSEIAGVCANEEKCSVYFVRRNVVLDGRELRWNLTSAFWIERVLRPEQARYVGGVHEKLVFEGRAGRLRSRIKHHQFEKGIDDWLHRRLRYAQMERALVTGPPEQRAEHKLLRGTIRRRLWLKSVFQRLPARWAIYFLFNLIFALAFLDGRRGIRYVGLEAYSHYLSTRVRRSRKC